jgi:hypothetical protein
MISAEEAIATPAVSERAWPTAPTDAPRSSPIATIVGASTAIIDCEAIVARIRGASHAG